MVDWPTEGAAERWGGYTFSAVDATVVCGPGAVGTDARVHTKLRVADVSLTDVQVTDEHGGESFRSFSWAPGELAVGDRAYFTPPGIQHVLDAGGDVLVRYDWKVSSFGTRTMSASTCSIASSISKSAKHSTWTLAPNFRIASRLGASSRTGCLTTQSGAPAKGYAVRKAPNCPRACMSPRNTCCSLRQPRANEPHPAQWTG